MLKEILIENVPSYLLENPGRPLYIMGSDNEFVYRLMYNRGPRLEVINYWNKEVDEAVKEDLGWLTKDTTFRAGDRAYTLEGIKAILDKEGVA